MSQKGARSEQEMQITLRRLAQEFGENTAPAEGLTGAALAVWLDQAEDDLFEKLIGERGNRNEHTN